MLFVQEHEPALQRRQHLFDFNAEGEIPSNGGGEFIAGKIDADVTGDVGAGSRGLFVSQRHKLFQNRAGHLLPQGNGSADVLPAPFQPHPVAVLIHMADLKASRGGGKAFAVMGYAFDEQSQNIGAGLKILVGESLIETSDIQLDPVAVFGIRIFGPHQTDELFFKPANALKCSECVVLSFRPEGGRQHEPLVDQSGIGHIV